MTKSSPRKLAYNAQYQREHKVARVIITNRWKKKNMEKVIACTTRWKKKNKDKVLAYAQRHSNNHPEQVHGVSIARSVQKARSCIRCGSNECLQHHHPDYSKPREVMTLCTKCHSRLHRFLGPFTKEQALNTFLEGEV